MSHLTYEDYTRAAGLYPCSVTTSYHVVLANVNFKTHRIN